MDLQTSDIPASTGQVLDRLATTIESRLPAQGGDPNASYVARLLQRGPDAFLKKVGEEATEVVMAGKDLDAAQASGTGVDESRARLVGEVADLWFHSMVALAQFGLTPADVVAELARREGLSGLQEFAQRRQQPAR